MKKQPWKKNKNSGNVSLSKEQYQDVKDGKDTSLYVQIGGKQQEVVIEQWMIEASREYDEYVLLPYTKGSWLAKKYFAGVSQK